MTGYLSDNFKFVIVATEGNSNRKLARILKKRALMPEKRKG